MTEKKLVISVRMPKNIG